MQVEISSKEITLQMQHRIATIKIYSLKISSKRERKKRKEKKINSTPIHLIRTSPSDSFGKIISTDPSR